MASNSELDELKKLLAETEETEVDSDQKRFFRAVGAQPARIAHVGADIIYYKYLMWKEAIGETDVIAWGVFFRKDKGFPKWIQKQVYTGQTKYRLDPKPFPVNSDIRLQMRKAWHRNNPSPKKRPAGPKTPKAD